MLLGLLSTTLPFATTDATASPLTKRQVTDHQVSRSNLVPARLAERLTGYRKSTHIGRTLYRVYGKYDSVAFTVHVLPNDKQNQNVIIRVQTYRRGGWHTVDAHSYLLWSSSNAGIMFLSLTRVTAVGHLYRISAQYPGDSENAAADGAWLYYTVRD